MTKLFTNIVVHYDEISLKGKNRAFFVDKLIDSLRKVAGSGHDVKKAEGKVVIEKKKGYDFEEMEVLVKKVQLIPGVSIINPALSCDSNMDEITKKAVEIAKYYKPDSFKVNTTRSYKPFELTSMQISSQVGAGVLNELPDLKVSMKEPELLIKIELAKKITYIMGQRYLGVGGLPVGSTGKVVCLLSGGIDSPVAAYEMMKRGCRCVFVHFHNQTINKKGVENKIKKLVETLSLYQGTSKLYIVPFAELQKQVISQIPADLRMIVYRRLMYQLADKIAAKEKALALVTGDSLAQVASQTLENLSVIYSATDRLKLAPLIGMNKIDISKRSEQIGTYETSIEPYEDCCSLMIAKHPETRSTLSQIQDAESSLDVQGIIKATLEDTKLIKI
jgi:tRNA uracil 4-sulfurtransferase